MKKIDLDLLALTIESCVLLQISNILLKKLNTIDKRIAKLKTKEKKNASQTDNKNTKKT